MLGDVGLGCVERVDQFIDGELALLELLEDAEAEWLAEGSEAWLWSW